MKTSKIKTNTRNVKQTIRRFTDEQKREIIRQIDNRPSNVKKSDMFKKFGLSKGNAYYMWKERFGMYVISHRKTVKSKHSMNVPMNVGMNVKSTKKLHTITLTVEVSSLIELVGLCNHIGQLPKVKTILSVE